MNNQFFDFYNLQSNNHKLILTNILTFIENGKGPEYKGKQLRTTEYRKNKLLHYLNDLDGTLMVDLLYNDIHKLFTFSRIL